MELKETFVSRQEIFHGRIVDLRVDTVRLPNGHLTTRSRRGRRESRRGG